MPYCTKCGAPLKDAARFCAKCGAPAGGGIETGQAPRRDRSRGLARSPLPRTVCLCALVLVLAFGAFRLVSAPAQNTPAGTLTLLMDALSQADTDRDLRCLDLSVQAQAEVRRLLDANSAAMLRALLQGYAGDGGYPLPPESHITSVRVVASSFHYTDYNGNACAVDALLSVRTPAGEYGLTLRGVPAVNRDGAWLISL